jgi:two-component system catabolic regulation response regulator CreB
MTIAKILIIEDEKPIADTIIYALKTERFESVWCANGGDALKQLSPGDFALIIIDIGLPDINGFELCKKIRSFSSIPIIFLTARSEEVDRIVGLEIGADDYMVKPFSPRELAARVRAILRRTSPQFNGTEVEQSTPDDSFSIDDLTKSITYKSIRLELTKQEYMILRSMIKHPGRVFSREQLLEIAWEESGFCSERTVDTYIKTLRSKLHSIDETADPIVTHRGFGYSLRNPL